MNNNSKTTQQIEKIVKGKRVLYIATKNRDYLRLEQEILLLKQYADNVDIIVSTSKNYIIRILYVYWNIIVYLKHFDVVFIGFAPQLVLPVFKWKFKEKPIVIDFFISIYDTLIFDRQKFKHNFLVSKILKKLDMLTLSLADLIICDTKEHSKYFINELGAKSYKTIILYLNADPKYYFPKKKMRPNNLQDKFIVLYFGSVLPLQGVNVILGAIKLIDLKDIHFIIIGPINNKLKFNHLNNITFIDWLSQETLSDYIAFSDLCLAGHFNNTIEKAKRTIPGKAYIYEAMQKKMILGDNNATRERYPALYKNVEFVKMGDEIALADKIMQEYKRVKNVNSI